MNSFLKLLFKHLIFAVLTAYFFNWLNQHFFNFKNSTQNGLIGIPILAKNFIILVFAPIIETILFQLPLSNIKNFSYNWFFLIMCLLFASVHYYNPIYFVFSIFLGLNFNVYFMRINKESNVINAFLYTLLLHILFNLYGFLFVV